MKIIHFQAYQLYQYFFSDSEKNAIDVSTYTIFKTKGLKNIYKYYFCFDIQSKCFSCVKKKLNLHFTGKCEINERISLQDIKKANLPENIYTIYCKFCI